MPLPGIGEVMQIAYVVDDIDKAIEHWTNKLGVGPFFVNRHASYTAFEYRGSKESPDLSLAFAFSGQMNIELIQQHDETPSAFLDFRRSNGQGLQHLGVISADIDRQTAELAARGVNMLQRLVNGGSGVETRFFDTELHPGTMLELIALSPRLQSGFAAMKQAAQTWDGVTQIAN